jgi:hypothetical protein
MALLKIKDFDPNYKETFGGYDLKGASVYSEVTDEKIGSVDDLLVDEQGHFRYFIVDIGFWGFGKKVLLPVGRSQVDSEGKRVYALGFTKEQAEHLPEFSEDLKIDNTYEEQVRGVYRPSETRSIESPMRPTDLPERGAPIGPTSHQQDMPSQPCHPLGRFRLQTKRSIQLKTPRSINKQDRPIRHPKQVTKLNPHLPTIEWNLNTHRS